MGGGGDGRGGGGCGSGGESEGGGGHGEGGGGFDVGGDGGGSTGAAVHAQVPGDVVRGLQSSQSVAQSQAEYSLPWPPSSHSPSAA